MLDKLPKSMHGKAKQALHDIYLAESRQSAEQGLDRFVAHRHCAKSQLVPADYRAVPDWV